MEIKLPLADTTGKTTIEQCISGRRSIRNYNDISLSLSEISQLLWSAQGFTDKNGFRASPSAGATFPLEIRVINSEGVFHYIPDGHKLKEEQTGDLRKLLCEFALGQGFIMSAGCSFVISTVYERTTKRYGERGVMYVHLEAGHTAENIELQAVALGLGSVSVGAFKEKEVKKLLKLPENEIPIYIISVGHIK